jgi:hypothetical protein
MWEKPLDDTPDQDQARRNRVSGAATAVFDRRNHQDKDCGAGTYGPCPARAAS